MGHVFMSFVIPINVTLWGPMLPWVPPMVPGQKMEGLWSEVWLGEKVEWLIDPNVP